MEKDDEDTYLLIVGDGGTQPGAVSFKEEQGDVKIKPETLDCVRTSLKSAAVFLKEEANLKPEHELVNCSSDDNLIEWHLDEDFYSEEHENKYDPKKPVKRKNVSKKQPKRKKYSKKKVKAKNNTRKQAKKKSDTKKKTKMKLKTPKIKVSIYHSYVAKLREANPRMRTDEDWLVARLMYTMKNTKPPPPPSDAFRVLPDCFECLKCDKKVNSRPSIMRHFQEIHGSRYLVCLACGKDFTSINTIYKHERRCGSPDAPLVLKARARCLMRKGRGAKDKPIFDETPLPPSLDCSECGASFASRQGLQRHENMHLGIRPYQCDQCPAAYTSKTALMRHLAAKHSDECYQCDICGTLFKWKVAIIKHMNVHLPIPKYGCNKCSQRYANKDALQRHVNKVHLNIPPQHACIVCSKKFYRMTSLTTHMKNQHGLSVMTPQQFKMALPTMSETDLKEALAVYKSDTILGP